MTLGRARHHERLGLILLRELLQVRRQRSGVGADAHGNPGALGRPDNQLDLVGTTDVARVDPHRGDAGTACAQANVADPIESANAVRIETSRRLFIGVLLLEFWRFRHQ